MKQATLTITVEYDEDPDDEMIEYRLRNVARMAAGNGMLSGDGELTVDSWDCDVKIGASEDTDAEARAELARLEAQFAAAGGRGVELAEQIDELRAELGETL